MEEKKKPAPWILFGAPLGCCIGIALRNLPIGIVIGILLPGVASAIQAQRSDKKINPLIYAAFGTSALVIAVLLFLKK